MTDYTKQLWQRLVDGLQKLSAASQGDAIEVRSRISYYCFQLREQFLETHLDRWRGDGWFEKIGPGICNVMAGALLLKIWEDSFLRNQLNGNKLAVYDAESDNHEWLIVQHGSGQQWILDASRAGGVLFDSPKFVGSFDKAWADLKFTYIESLEHITPIQKSLEQYE